MLSKLYLPKWCEIPLLLASYRDEAIYYQNILRKTHIASSHVRNTFRLLMKSGFIIVDKDAKIQPITLTRKGEELVNVIRKFKKMLEQNE